MARCGCSGTSCSCQVEADPSSTITVTGSGSGASPYVIGGGGVVTVLDSSTIDFTLTGVGSSGSPYLITGDATIDVEDLANLDVTGVGAGDVIAYNGTSWETIPAPSATPGLINTDGTISGDGSGGDPLKIEPLATGTYVPTWTATTTDPDIGSGTISGRYVADPTSGWVDVSIDITIASDTQKGSGYYSLSLPPGLDSLAGQTQLFTATIFYGSLGTIRVGTAYTNGGSDIARILVTNSLSSYGSSIVSGSLLSTLPAGGHIVISGRYEREP